MQEPRRPEGRPTLLPVGRASARRLLPRCRKPVGLKADPQGVARFCGSGFSPTPLAPMQESCSVGRAFRPTHFERPRRPEGRPTGMARRLRCWKGVSPTPFAPMQEAPVGLKADPQGSARRPEGRPTEPTLSPRTEQRPPASPRSIRSSSSSPRRARPSAPTRASRGPARCPAAAASDRRPAAAGTRSSTSSP